MEPNLIEEGGLLAEGGMCSDFVLPHSDFSRESGVPELKQRSSEVKKDACRLSASQIHLLQNSFHKCVKGYHLINISPINEHIWEDINALIFQNSQIDVHSMANGSHRSGMDISSSIGSISNKSAKYNKNRISFDLSSYRLTKVCNTKSCGDLHHILQEIDCRKNFDYYSILVRDDFNLQGKQEIHYDWIMIPSDFALFNPYAYEWSPDINRNNTQVGWKTNLINNSYMSIRFSMSSQLWYHIHMTDNIRQFMVDSVVVNTNPCLDYLALYETYSHLTKEQRSEAIGDHNDSQEPEL